MTADDVLYVVAGNYQQYVHWCLDREMSPRDRRVRYVASGHSLLGARQGLRYTVTGTWRERRDIRQIGEELAVRDGVRDDEPR